GPKRCCSLPVRRRATACHTTTASTTTTAIAISTQTHAAMRTSSSQVRQRGRPPRTCLKPNEAVMQRDTAVSSLRRSRDATSRLASVLDTSIPLPLRGRTYSSRRRVRLSDMDSHGRLRLDAVARFLQDVAIDDVQETGWGTPEHLWFVRRVRLDVLRPFLDDRTVVLTTWCSGTAALAAGRRWSVTGDAGGRIEVDSVWIHLDAGGNPVRIEDF